MMPPHFFFAALIAALLLHWLVPGQELIDAPVSYAGAVLVAVGLWVAAAASRQFDKAGTAIRPFEQSSALVTDGWFRFSRNPMYLSMLVALSGVAILLGSATAFLPLPVLAGILQLRFIRREEVVMRERFGNKYAAYCQRVRRWL